MVIVGTSSPVCQAPGSGRLPDSCPAAWLGAECARIPCQTLDDFRGIQPLRADARPTAAIAGTEKRGAGRHLVEVLARTTLVAGQRRATGDQGIERLFSVDTDNQLLIFLLSCCIAYLFIDFMWKCPAGRTVSVCTASPAVGGGRACLNPRCPARAVASRVAGTTTFKSQASALVSSDGQGGAMNWLPRVFKGDRGRVKHGLPRHPLADYLAVSAAIPSAFRTTVNPNALVSSFLYGSVTAVRVRCWNSPWCSWLISLYE